MIRTLTLTILAALSLVLTGCDTTTEPTAQVDPPIPTGAQAPRTVLQVIAGTKAAPVDTPVVKITWWHADTVNLGFLLTQTSSKIGTMGSLSQGKISWSGDSTLFSPIPNQALMKPFSIPSDSYSFKAVGCKDSLFVVIVVSPLGGADRNDSTWVYCRH